MTSNVPILKSSDKWLDEPQFREYQILDPDGWDRNNLDSSFKEPITRQEFIQRLHKSTIQSK